MASPARSAGPGALGRPPVEALEEERDFCLRSLRDLEAEAVNVADKDEEASKLLSTRDDAELGRLLDRVDGVAAGIGKSDDLRPRRLRLQQERGEVGAREWMPHPAQDPAAIGLDHRRGVALERVSERIVGADEEPRLAARLHNR